MKKSLYFVALATVVASSLFAAGCSSDRAKADGPASAVTPIDPAPIAQQEQQTPSADDTADLGAASSGRGR